MTFPHEDSEFGELLRIVAGERGVSEALVEKDYWVTHTLWALSESKLAVWFKGGTSLSKGFGLITRFSDRSAQSLLRAAREHAEGARRAGETAQRDALERCADR